MSILIVIMISMMMVVIVDCYDVRENDRAPRLTDGPRHFRQTKEPREKRGHVEQCRDSQFRRFLREEQLGHVNVFAFLDPSWYYSYRQFIMLELLKKRLEKSGFSNISFFVVTPSSYLLKDSTESSLEIKAWKEVSKNMMESEYFLDTEEALFNDPSRKENEIVFLRDDGELGIWEDFRAAKDEVAIIDRCGKIAYQIIIPWSILYFPYVKAAILSTYRENPCGLCEVNLSTVDSLNYEQYRLKNINLGEGQIDNTRNMHTEGTFTDVEASISFDESRNMTHNRNASTIVPLNGSTYDSTVYNKTTETAIVQKGKSKNVPNNDSVNEKNEQSQEHIASTISDSVTTEIYAENQDNIHRNNNNSFLESTDPDSNLTTNYTDGSESDISLKKEEGGQKDESADLRTSQEQKDKIFPLRIILYAPHLHEENGTLQKYTHSVLKTGSPDYHDHFHTKTIDHK
ncbi:uncharacterized protein LOC108625307 isoform X2 [Ceratina calcarata]|nr:uncharacterized protein LOC108625307 isoform X2 [Ceratina calcarata]